MSAADVSKWAAKVRDATLRRNQAIREMRDAGAPLRAIAAAAGLTHAAIAKNVKKENL